VKQKLAVPTAAKAGRAKQVSALLQFGAQVLRGYRAGGSAALGQHYAARRRILTYHRGGGVRKRLVATLAFETRAFIQSGIFCASSRDHLLIEERQPSDGLMDPALTRERERRILHHYFY
jgi:hypothetical protein